MRTVAILHGWSGGNWHTKKFRQELKNANFKIVKDAVSADIIVAHSTGCYIIPKGIKAELLLLIGLPWWPGRSIYRRLWQKQVHETSHHIAHHGWGYTLRKYGWAVIYVLLNPFYVFIAIRNHKFLDFLDELKNKKIILVRNEEDYFSSPDIGQAISHNRNIKYIKLPGVHDDYYGNPQPYIDLIRKEL